MKNILKFTTLACMMAVASNSMAAGPTANVKVSGSVKTGACTPTLDNGGVIDLGAIDANSISASGKSMPTTHFNLIINCSTPTAVEWSFTDNRYDSVVTTSLPGMLTLYRNGLGVTSDNKKIGAYHLIRSSDVIVTDGINRDLIQSNGTWSKSNGGDVSMQSTNSGAGLNYSVANTGTVVPVAFSTATFPLYTRMAISGEMNTITQIENIDGNMTFNLEYL